MDTKLIIKHEEGFIIFFDLILHPTPKRPREKGLLRAKLSIPQNIEHKMFFKTNFIMKHEDQRLMIKYITSKNQKIEFNIYKPIQDTEICLFLQDVENISDFIGRQEKVNAREGVCGSETDELIRTDMNSPISNILVRKIIRATILRKLSFKRLRDKTSNLLNPHQQIGLGIQSNFYILTKVYV